MRRPPLCSATACLCQVCNKARRHGTIDSRNTPLPSRQSVRKGGAPLGACAVGVFLLGDWRASGGEVGAWPECGPLARPTLGWKFHTGMPERKGFVFPTRSMGTARRGASALAGQNVPQHVAKSTSAPPEKAPHRVAPHPLGPRRVRTAKAPSARPGCALTATPSSHRYKPKKLAHSIGGFWPSARCLAFGASIVVQVHVEWIRFCSDNQDEERRANWRRGVGASPTGRKG